MCLVICASLFSVFAHTAAAQTLTASQRAALEQELARVEQQQKAAEADLAAARAQSASLSRDVSILDAKIKAAQLDIKAKNLLIQTLGNDIVSKQNRIQSLEGRISDGKDSLAQILRKTNEISGYSLPEVLLSQSTVTGFFKDVDTFEAVQEGLRGTFERLRQDEASTTAEKAVLENRQNKEMDARHAIEVQKANIQSDQAQKQQLLAASKGNEKSYAGLVAEKQAKAGQIRAALFALAGGSNPIPFGTALKYAQTASQRTGVDPAFLLAILTQESNLGANVGRCYLTDATTGNGVNVTTGAPSRNVMKPGRDVQPFIDITKSLGLDPFRTVVSCQQVSVGGWGGAMGPAQFIASTWVLLKERVSQALGIAGTPANPWNPEHAIMAEALFMADLGAGAGTYSAQLNAACRYFAGGTRCTTTSRPYGNSVMSLAARIQRDQINPLLGL